MARTAGVLYLCGAALVAMSLVLVHPTSADMTGLVAMVAIATLTGIALFVFAEHVPQPLLHVTGALAATCTSLCIVFAGIAAGIYPGMYMWLILYTACFFPGWPALGHLTWVLVNYGVVLAVVDNSAGFSSVTRFFSSAFVFGVASVTVSWLVAGRRRTMSQLEHEVEIREELERQLQKLADHDHLTGLGNRRRLERDSAREVAEARRHDRPLTVAMIDIDGFKQVNDSAGHAEGDELLKEIAFAWSDVLRTHDLLARVGGDEFVVVLSDCDADQATEVLERMRAAMPGGQTCSIGVAELGAGEGFTDTLARADAMLYRAKRSGRDRVAAVAG